MSGLSAIACLLLADAGLVLLVGSHLRLLLIVQGVLLLLASVTAATGALAAEALTLTALLLGPVIVVPWRVGGRAPAARPRLPASLVLLLAAVLGASLAAPRVLPNDPQLAAALLASLAVGVGGGALAAGVLQAACLATAQNAALLGVLALAAPGPLPALLILLAAASITLLLGASPERTPT